MIQTTFFNTNKVGSDAQGEIVDIYDLPQRIKAFYEAHPNTKKDDMPAILPHITGRRTTIDGFRENDALGQGSLIFIDFDNINKPDSGQPNITRWCIENREKLFSWFDGGYSNVLGLQESPSGNLHIFLYAPFTSYTDFEPRARFYTAAFCKKLLNESGIDVRYPVQPGELNRQGQRKSNDIIDDHNCHIYQFMKLSPNPLYLNREERLIFPSLTDKAQQVLQREYPTLFKQQVNQAKVELSSINVSKKIKEITYKADHLTYDKRWKIANTATKVMSEDEVYALMSQYTKDADLKGIIHSATTRLPTQEGIDWLKERGIEIKAELVSIGLKAFDKISCPVMSQLHEMKTIELDEDEYLGQKLKPEDITNTHTEIYADCGIGKTEFCFDVLRKTKGDLLVPMNSTLNGKFDRQGVVKKANLHSWNPNISQSMVFDTWTNAAYAPKDITFIDEYHLLVDQGDFRSVCYNLKQKIQAVDNKEGEHKICTLTGTPYEIEDNDADKIYVKKKSKFNKNLQVILSNEPNKALISQVVEEVKKGRLVLLPTDRDGETMKLKLEAELGEGTVELYRRDYKDSDDVTTINIHNRMKDGKKVLMCTSYLNVGCEIKMDEEIVTIVNITNNKYTGQQLHQFASRVRESNRNIIIIVKNNINLLTWHNLSEQRVDNEALVELMNQSSEFAKSVKAHYHYFEDDFTINESKEIFQMHNKSLIDFYSQFPVVINFLVQLGYDTTFEIRNSKLKITKVNAETKTSVNEYVKNNMTKFKEEYGEARANNQILYGEDMKLTDKGYTTPAGNYTDKLYTTIKRLEKHGLSEEQILEVLECSDWSLAKVSSVDIIFNMVENDDKLAQKICNAKLKKDDRILERLKHDLTADRPKEVQALLESFIDMLVRATELFVEWKGDHKDFVLTLLKVASENARKKNEKRIVIMQEDGTEICRGNGVEVCTKMGWKKSTFDSRANYYKYKGYLIERVNESDELMDKFKEALTAADKEVYKMLDIEI